MPLSEYAIRLACACAAFIAAVPAVAQTTVFINEIHYDNTGTDQGESIEVAGPAGTDLLGIHIRATHTFAIGAFTDSATISETVVYRIEPKAD